MSVKSYQSFLANHASIMTKRVLELEYSIRVFKKLYPDVFDFICEYRSEIEWALANDTLIPEVAIKNLFLVDTIFDFIQLDEFSFSLNFLADYNIEVNYFIALAESILNKFAVQVINKCEGSLFFHKNFIASAKYYRFADISGGNDLKSVINAYVRSSLRFKDQDLTYENRFKNDILECASLFNPFRTPSRKAVGGSIIGERVSSIDGLNYITLGLNAFNRTEDLPLDITSFLISYKQFKIAGYMKKLGMSDFDPIIANSELKTIQELIDHLDVAYSLHTDFKKHVSLLPNLLGLLHWDLNDQNYGSLKVFEIQNKVIEIYDDICKSSGGFSEELSQDAVKKQLTNTRQKISKLATQQEKKYIFSQL